MILFLHLHRVCELVVDDAKEFREQWQEKDNPVTAYFLLWKKCDARSEVERATMGSVVLYYLFATASQWLRIWLFDVNPSMPTDVWPFLLHVATPEPVFLLLVIWQLSKVNSLIECGDTSVLSKVRKGIVESLDQNPGNQGLPDSSKAVTLLLCIRSDPVGWFILPGCPVRRPVFYGALATWILHLILSQLNKLLLGAQPLPL
jgi:hypothetical protein